MTPAEIKTARIAAGLTQQQAAELVCVHLRSWQKWEGGERQMPASAWKLFGLLTAP
jgi:putative transcriptional regulator